MQHSFSLSRGFPARLLGSCIFSSFDWATIDDDAFVNTKSPAICDICSLHSFTHDINLLPSSTLFHPFYPYLYVAYIRSVGLHQKTSFYKLKVCFYLSELLIVIALPRSSLTYFQVLISRLSGAHRSVQMPITRESIFDRISTIINDDHTMRTVFFGSGNLYMFIGESFV